MKKTLIVIGALLTFAFLGFVPPDGVSKMPVEKITVNIDSPFLQVNAQVSGTAGAQNNP